MGRNNVTYSKLALLAFFTLLFSVNTSHAQKSDTIEYDSVELKTHFIYMCDGHFFEWCDEEVNCGYCNELLKKINLWEYYKKLECEDCKTFFDENYLAFLGKENTL